MTDDLHPQELLSWDLLGGPEGGSVYALALAEFDETVAFAATGIGIFRSKGDHKDVGKTWARLADSPGKTMAIAISPNFPDDHFLVAGNRTGIYYSPDGGASWQGAQMPRTTSAIQALVISPDFAKDGVILAGTEEDGVLISEDHGRQWTTRNFGFLDACVYTLAISPGFSSDETAFSGTNTGLYRTINGGRAWREVAFPAETGPILSLGISPAFSRDETIFAGTEEAGLLRSTNRGKSWHVLEIPGTMVNAIQVSNDYEEDHNVIISTENGIFQSSDNGNHWQVMFEVEGVICLGAIGQSLLAGLIDHGLYRCNDLTSWEPVDGFFAREISSFRLSPAFEQDFIAFSYGTGEGIWRTMDGGKSWVCLNDGLPGTGISDIQLSPAFHHNHRIYTASSDGVLMSHDAGEHWDICYSEPVNHLAISPSGRTLLAGTGGVGVVISRDSGLHWESLGGPWATEGDIQAVALGSDNQFFVAAVDALSHNLVIGQGRPGQWRRILSHPSTNELVFFYIPTSYSADNLWYASTGSNVWRVGLRKDLDPEGLPISRGTRSSKRSVNFVPGGDANDQ